MVTARTEALQAMLSSAADALFPILILAAFAAVAVVLFKILSDDGDKDGTIG